MKLSKAAREMFQRFGAQGGKARARKLTATQRAQAAQKASRARWEAVQLAKRNGDAA